MDDANPLPDISFGPLALWAIGRLPAATPDPWSIDELIVPKPGKKTKASKVLKELWVAEEIESADIVDFLSDLFSKRRPT